MLRLRQEIFDYQWARLAGREDQRLIRDDIRRRLARVKYAQRYAPYLLAATATVGTGLADTTAIARTPVLTHPLLVLDSKMITGQFAEVEIQRTNPSRTQVSREFLWRNHYSTAYSGFPSTQNGNATGEAPLLSPLSLEPNELLRVVFRQTVAVVPANAEQTVTFRCIGLNRNPCPAEHWEDIEDYIRCERNQRPVYLAAVTDSGRSIVFPAVGAAQRTTAQTREAKYPTLITGFTTSRMESSSIFPDTTTLMAKVKILSSLGHVFTPIPVCWISLLPYTRFAENGQGAGWVWYYELPVPYFLPRGGTLTLQFTDAQIDADNINGMEWAFYGVTA